MAYRLLIRYYPVDGDWSDAQSQSAAFGLALWAQPMASYYDDMAPTMGTAISEWMNGAPVSEGEFVPGQWGGSWQYRYASVVEFSASGLVEGQYVEKEILLLEEDGSTVRQITPADLPLSLVIAGAGKGDTDWERPEVYAIDGFPGAWIASVYAGGAVEIGLDDGETFTRLASFWVNGSFFSPKPGLESWSNPVLPPSYPEIISLAPDGLIRILLDADVPKPLFWTQIKQAVEV